MELPPALLELLACPACHGTISAVTGGEGVVCASCGRVYPVVDGILTMLVSEARMAGTDGAPPSPEGRSSARGTGQGSDPGGGGGPARPPQS